MTYEECTNLVAAFEYAVTLANNDVVCENSDLSEQATCIKDSLGEFITSLLFESPIGDRHATDAHDGCEL